MADRPRGGPDRAFPRVAIDAFVRVLGATPEGREYVFRTRDLSAGGLFLYTRVGHLYPFRVGAALSIELYDFDRAVEFSALVVRVVEPGSAEAERFPMGFGVKIVQIDEASRARLDELLARAASGEDPY
jgi:c-di-GMP-binding flagellar brake protein YcgR